MTTKILVEFKQHISAMTMVPSDGGRFEFKVNGKLIYSKLETGEFPDEDAILKEIRSRL